jgi:hypothetical protein
LIRLGRPAGGFWARGSALQSGAEPYQRLSDIVKQAIPWRIDRTVAGDENVVGGWQGKARGERGGGGAEPALGAVPGYRVADFLGGGKAQAHGPAIVAPAGLDDHDRPSGPDALADSEEFRAIFETRRFQA